MIRSDLLERFILGFGLAIANNGLGRPTTITPLWLAAKDECGECSIDEVLDSLYNLNPQHVELYKFVAIGGGFQSVSFERRRNTPQWQDFFTRGDFRIKVLPLGRRRFEEMSESVATSEHSTRQTDYHADLDRRCARLAIEEALKSVPEDERPHPKVGAVVVKDGNILSKAHRGEKEKSHAEYVALEDKLSDDLIAGSTVYTAAFARSWDRNAGFRPRSDANLRRDESRVRESPEGKSDGFQADCRCGQCGDDSRTVVD